MRLRAVLFSICCTGLCSGQTDQSARFASDTKQTATYERIRSHLDSIRAINAHDHLEFDKVPGLYTLWRESYFGTFIPQLAPKTQHVPVPDWWPQVQLAFTNGRTMSFYRYQLPAFQDLYGVDFNKLSMEEAEVAANKKRDWWDKEFRTLVTLGESTTAGGWASYRERAWAHQLARTINEFQRVPIQLVNVGIGANVISTRSPSYEHSGKPAALLRLDQHVIRHKPDLLIVSYGLNDARGGTPLTLFIEEMTTLIERVSESIQPLIVMLSPYYITGFDQYGPHFNKATLEIFHQFAAATRKLAGEKNCLFADVLNCYGNADWLIHHDTVHANDLGHLIVANQVFEVLATNCSGLAKETQELEQHIPRWRDESVLQNEIKK